MGCLKRPFDDQTQPQIRLESEAVLAQESDAVQFVRSGTLRLENSFNPNRERALRVAEWLNGGRWVSLDQGSAELAGADVFGTVDDRLIAAALRNSASVRVKVASTLDVYKELRK